MASADDPITVALEAAKLRDGVLTFHQVETASTEGCTAYTFSKIRVIPAMRKSTSRWAEFPSSAPLAYTSKNAPAKSPQAPAAPAR